VAQFKLALRPLRELYGCTPAAGFGPKKLKAVRQRMIDAGLCRTVVNRYVGRVRTVFRWAESEELVPAASHHALRTLAGLPRNARGVRHTPACSPDRL
jgi:hypothetical protein